MNKKYNPIHTIPMSSPSGDIEVYAHTHPAPYSWTPDGDDPGPPRIDIDYVDSGIEAICLESADETDCLIEVLIQERERVWGPRDRGWVAQVRLLGCDYRGCDNPIEMIQIMGPDGSWNNCCGEHLETGMAHPVKVAEGAYGPMTREEADAFATWVIALPHVSSVGVHPMLAPPEEG